MQIFSDRRRPAFFPVGVLLTAGVLLAALPARAETIDAAPTNTGSPSASAKTAKKPATSGTQTRVETFRAIVHGFYLEAKVGGGYMVLEHKVHPDAFNPNVKGSEGLGGGASVAVALGIDIAEPLALQLMVGDKMVGGRRNDRVRDLSMAYVAVGPRFYLSTSDRFKFLITPAGTVVLASNAVDSTNKPVGGLLLGLGFEYYAHVRHFSVGLELQGMMVGFKTPRVFIGLTPTVKYTF